MHFFLFLLIDRVHSVCISRQADAFLGTQMCVNLPMGLKKRERERERKTEREKEMENDRKKERKKEKDKGRKKEIKKG